MLNRTGIKKESAVNPAQILFDVQNRKAVSIKVDAAAGDVDGNRTIVRAGTPLTGDLTNRSAAFSAAGASDAVGVLLHDVDVTDGAGNGTLLIWGFVNLNRLDSDTAAKITDGVKTALKGAVWFLKD